VSSRVGVKFSSLATNLIKQEKSGIFIKLKKVIEWQKQKQKQKRRERSQSEER